MGLFEAGSVSGRNCVACGANLLGLFAALVVEIGKFVSAFGVHLVQDVRIDGVICGGRRGRAELRINNRNYGIVIVRFDGIFCRLKDVSFDYND